MTDTSGGKPPFAAFPGMPGFSQGDMMGKMWELMRLNPFAAAAMPSGGQGMNPSLSMMSDMLAPLTNIEELDKRVTDMRAVEQWLKLNLNMLQSAIQALEVQRATLATLRAFGAYAQSSVENAQAQAPAEKPKASGWPMNTPSATAKSEAREAAAAPPPPVPEARDEAKTGAGGANDAAFDPSGWWNVLQTQFNQLASLAMTQPGSAAVPDANPVGASGAGAEQQTQAAPPDAAGTEAAKKAPAKKAAPKKKPE
ncbi:hypothetical protein AWB67_01654 [Caballeronia terrestris]|uniref:Alginate biosynthesis protein AlgP n=1 Tax=Caballeronia terrestris TaxID=1226301 RepID=A0A158HCZ9_9BURK|nr:PhaM family polyhydroxyalkanoate granule multifunctional regulatory protein [Caballeronia terrestris]SAL42245.1 hypothetical protein AWB67_01654 [Caballeronia terrestris]